MRDPLKARARTLYGLCARRAKADGVCLDFTVADVLDCLRNNITCRYCKLPLAGDASLDHLTPISRGGSHLGFNVAVCCRRCNAIKGSLTESEFEFLREALANMADAGSQDVMRRLQMAGAKIGKVFKRKKLR